MCTYVAGVMSVSMGVHIYNTSCVYVMGELKHSHKPHPLVGVLCGSCPQGCGVSVLTNRCVTCGNENGLLILALCKPTYLQS